MDYSLQGSSAQGICQARILEWLPFPSPGNLSDSGIEPTSLLYPTLWADSLPLSHQGSPNLHLPNFHCMENFSCLLASPSFSPRKYCHLIFAFRLDLKLDKRNTCDVLSQDFPNIFLICQLMPFFERRQWHPTPVLLPGKSHGRRSLVGCSPWGFEELDMTEWLHFHFSLSCTEEGNGNPLQCPCLENPRDGEAWWAAIYGVAESRTRLKRLSSSSNSSNAIFDVYL